MSNYRWWGQLSLVASLISLVSWGFANTAPVVVGFPNVGSGVVVANGVTVHTLTMTVEDAEGYEDIHELRALFNFTESGGDNNRGRGYLAWSKTDERMTKFGGTWTIADAQGGGRWGWEARWNSLNYITAVGCSVTTSGAASGAAGRRTVVWSFKANPIWVANPLTNDADAWTADEMQYRVGWLDGPHGFDVVRAPCTTTLDTPREPLLSNPTATTIDLTIDPADSDTASFAIEVSPSLDGFRYVHQGGALGLDPAWARKRSWGTVRISGLLSDTTYEIQLRAFIDSAGYCPSEWGPTAQARTQVLSRSVDITAPGKPISPGVAGNSTALYNDQDSPVQLLTWEVVTGNSVRGIAGGMDADTYNWKNLSGQSVGHTGTPGPGVTTTLSWMRRVRDYEVPIPVITVNTRGIGPLATSGGCRFVYDDLRLETLVPLAADWVTYVNHILPNYREGDTLPAAYQAILDSIDWYGRPKLLSPGEPPTPRVTYWEIGNEPELTLPWCTPDAPTHQISYYEYGVRYKAIALAMLAADPEIQVGPCTITTRYAGECLIDPGSPVDFVSYHPYGPMGGYADTYGDTPDAAERALRVVRRDLVARHQGHIDEVVRRGRNPADIGAMASEYNPGSWRWSCTTQTWRMAHALGTADSVLTFGDLGLIAAHYWLSPSACAATKNAPAYKVWEMMQQHLGDRLLDYYTDGYNICIYTTFEDDTNSVAVWMMNFSEDKPVDVVLRFPGALAEEVTLQRLGRAAGDTSLFTSNSASGPVELDWHETVLTGVDLTEFPLTLDDATITLLLFDAAHSGGQSLGLY